MAFQQENPYIDPSMPGAAPPPQETGGLLRGAPQPPDGADVYAELQAMGQPAPQSQSPPQPPAEEQPPQDLPVLPRNYGDWSFPDGPQQAEGEPYPYAVFAYYHPGRASEIPADRLDEAMIGAQALAQNEYGHQAAVAAQQEQPAGGAAGPRTARAGPGHRRCGEARARPRRGADPRDDAGAVQGSGEPRERR